MHNPTLPVLLDQIDMGTIHLSRDAWLKEDGTPLTAVENELLDSISTETLIAWASSLDAQARIRQVQAEALEALLALLKRYDMKPSELTADVVERMSLCDRVELYSCARIAFGKVDSASLAEAV